MNGLIFNPDVSRNIFLSLFHYGNSKVYKRYISRQYNENGVTTDEERYGYASGSNNLRDRPNPHSRKREKAIGDDSVNSSSGLQGKHGIQTFHLNI